MTGTECLMRFPAKVQAEIVNNIARKATDATGGVGGWLSEEYNGMRDFLVGTFNWDESPEGCDYWIKILSTIP